MFIWTVKDIIDAVLLGLFLLCMLFLWVHTWWVGRKCKHEDVNENMACHAICKGCGKNMGFIGTWRAEQEKKRER